MILNHHIIICSTDDRVTQRENISSFDPTMAGLHDEEEQRNGANVQVLRASFTYVQDPLEHIGHCHHISLII